MAGLSEETLRKLITPNARALSKPNAVEKTLNDADPNSFNDFDDSMYLAETYDGGADQSAISDDYKYDPEAATILSARKETDYSSNVFNPDRVKKSKMLSAIKEEMVRNPIDTRALNSQLLESANGGSVDTNNSRLRQMIAGAKTIEEKLGGQTAAAPQRATPVERNSGIDYALIKTIVNECIETKLNEVLRNTSHAGVLNENAGLKGIVLKSGKIKLVDNSGNVYSAKLEYEGNTKNKK